MVGIEQIKEHWDRPAKIAVWITAIVGLFVLAPPSLWPATSDLAQTSDPKQWSRLAQFLTAIVVGLFFLRSNTAIGGAPWRAMAIGAAFIGVGLFVTMQFLTPAWTCGYLNEVVVKGATLSEGALDWAKQGADCKRLIGLAAGETSEVWPENELITRFVILAGIYTLTILAFALAALATIEFIRSEQGEQNTK